MRFLALALLVAPCTSTPDTTPSDTAPPPDASAPDSGSPGTDGGMDGGTVPPFTGPAQYVLTSPQATVTLRTSPFGMRVADPTGRVLLDTLDADPPGGPVAGDDVHAYGPLGGTHTDARVRTPIIEGWDHVTLTDNAWYHGAAVIAATVVGNTASIDLADPAAPTATFHLEVTLTGDDVLVVARSTGMATDAGTGTEVNRVGQTFVLPPDEHFFGLGERYVTVDHRGQHYECWVEEGGVGGGEHATPGPGNPGPNGLGMTHIPIPFVLSSRGYGLWLETTYRTGFVMGADDPRVWRVYASEPALRYHVLVHSDPRDTLDHFTRLTGRPHAPAAWVFAPRRRVDHGTMVAGVPEYQALRDHHVPTTMVDDSTHFLPGASEVGRETELRAWNTTLHALGFKSIAYFNPYVSASRPEAASLLADARSQGLFVRRADGTEFDTTLISAGAQSVATLDLTYPPAVTWFQARMQQALDMGYDGWMLDFGEYIPPDAVLRDGRQGWEAHNAFPLLLQHAAYDYLRRVRGDDFMFFARSGYTGTQSAVPMLWSGDPSASFDEARGLPANVRAGINAGLTGLPFWGSDISGYTCLNDPPADKEVYLRWAEFGALSPDMHDENACSAAPAGAPPKWTLWSDAETTTVYGQYARLHTRLVPYLLAAAKEAEATGLPIIRHPLLMHPTEPAALAVTEEYYLGPSLYVAPVVHRGAVTRDLWLPPGRWVDWWTLAASTGGQHVTRDAPLTVLPLFLRSGTLVPLLDPTVETLVRATVPGVVSAADVADVMDVRVAVDPSASPAHATLADGTVLEATVASGAAGMPAVPAGYATAATDADLSTCTRCARVDPLPGGGWRVRVTTSRTADERVAAGGLSLHHTAGTDASGTLRVRWDVVVLPAG